MLCVLNVPYWDSYFDSNTLSKLSWTVMLLYGRSVVCQQEILVLVDETPSLHYKTTYRSIGPCGGMSDSCSAGVHPSKYWYTWKYLCEGLSVSRIGQRGYHLYSYLYSLQPGPHISYYHFVRIYYMFIIFIDFCGFCKKWISISFVSVQVFQLSILFVCDCWVHYYYY